MTFAKTPAKLKLAMPEILENADVVSVNAPVVTDFRWVTFHMAEKSAFRTSGRPFNYC
jgi:hypothetical protein